MIHVYGLVEELAALPELGGIDDAPLERRRVGGLELVVSRAPGSAEVSRDDVLRHAQVVEELMSRSTAVLPAQFGRGFGSDDELVAEVEAKADDLARALTSVRACVEFGLRVLAAAEEAPSPPGVSTGAEYMRARLVEERRRDHVVHELHEPLARLARATAVGYRNNGSVLEAAYLVPAAQAAAFREAVLRLETERPELTVVCTGPWPPYSFAEGGA